MFFSTFEKRGREWVKIEILCHFSISVLIMNALVWIIKTNCLVTIHGNLYVIFIDLEPLSFLHISKILKHCGLNEWQHSFFLVLSYTKEASFLLLLLDFCALILVSLSTYLLTGREGRFFITLGQ